MIKRLLLSEVYFLWTEENERLTWRERVAYKISTRIGSI